MPRTLTPSPRPLGLGNDMGRLIGAIALGVVLASALCYGLEWGVEAAILEGWM